jgi:hypothetical protein
MVVRADEACHSHVNHTMSSLDADEQNPFRPCTPVLPPVRGLPPSLACVASLRSACLPRSSGAAVVGREHTE